MAHMMIVVQKTCPENGHEVASRFGGISTQGSASQMIADL